MPPFTPPPNTPTFASFTLPPSTPTLVRLPSPNDVFPVKCPSRRSPIKVKGELMTSYMGYDVTNAFYRCRVRAGLLEN